MAERKLVLSGPPFTPCEYNRKTQESKGYGAYNEHNMSWHGLNPLCDSGQLHSMRGRQSFDPNQVRQSVLLPLDWQEALNLEF